jgi:hypothetical protein
MEIMTDGRLFDFSCRVAEGVLTEMAWQTAMYRDRILWQRPSQFAETGLGEPDRAAERA